MSWFAYFITIISVIISLKLSCYIGRKLGLNMVTEEIALVPFRCKKLKIKYFLFSREATLELALLVRESIHSSVMLNQKSQKRK